MYVRYPLNDKWTHPIQRMAESTKHTRVNQEITAIFLIRVILAVIVMVTPVPGWDTTAIVTAKLGTITGIIGWKGKQQLQIYLWFKLPSKRQKPTSLPHKNTIIQEFLLVSRVITGSLFTLYKICFLDCDLQSFQYYLSTTEPILPCIHLGIQSATFMLLLGVIVGFKEG